MLCIELLQKKVCVRKQKGARSAITYKPYIRLSPLQLHMVGEIDGRLYVPSHGGFVDGEGAAEAGAEFVND